MMRLLRFAIVGVAGAAVHMGTFWLLQRLLGMGNSAAWLTAFFAAASATWAMNRRFTFRDRASGKSGVEWLSYIAVAALGAAAHFATFHAAISWLSVFTDHPALAIVPGSLASLTVTYAGASLLVFRNASSKP